MTDQAGKSTSGESTGQVVLKVILILAGVALILVLGVWIGQTMAGDTQLEGPEVIPPQPPADGPYVVANAYVNLRSGPGTEYPAYGVAPAGSSAEAIGGGLDMGWWMVKLPTTISPDGTGWVSAEYVTAYNTDSLPVPEPYTEP